MNKFQYKDETKEFVIQNLGENGTRSIPRGHPFWRSLGVQAAEDAGEILAHDYVEPPTLEEAKAVKVAEINTWRNTEENKSPNKVTVNGIDWDSDPSARERIHKALSSNMVVPFWTDANNVDQESFDLQAIHDAIINQGFLIHQRQRAMKDEISLLETVEDIQAYVVGWPEPATEPEPT